MKKVAGILFFVILICFDLGRLRSISFAQAENSYSDQLSEVEEHLNTAAEMADFVLEGIGADLPEIVILPNTYDAYASNNIIYLGDEMIRSLNAMELSQVILHEAGHIFEGHTGIINPIMDHLVSSGLMSADQRSEILRSDELIADFYAAIGSWILEPGVALSSFSQYLARRDESESDSHPASETRIEFVESVVSLLSAAELDGAFQEARFDGLMSPRDELSPEYADNKIPIYDSDIPDNHNSDSSNNDGHQNDGGGEGEGGGGGGDGGG